MAADPILDLSTLIADRPPLRIDGTTYHLKSPDELTLAESHKFTKWGKELEALGKDPDRTAELEALLKVVAAAALADVPPDVRQRLLPSHNVAIVEVFTVLLLGRRMRLAGAVASAGRSPGSSTPSGAIPDGGSMVPRQPSSEPT